MSAQSEPDADRFRVGDVWRSPSGTEWRVDSATGRYVILHSPTGRSSLRRCDDVGPGLTRPWKRISWGGR